jgi:hypothetical protein
VVTHAVIGLVHSLLDGYDADDVCGLVVKIAGELH